MSDCTVDGRVSADVKVQVGAMYSGWGVSVDVKVQGGALSHCTVAGGLVWM
jgi:hypothetical protein